ncbi:hypothetical protein [Microbulbifer sp. SH-1]|uniref:hypothetical protein n=1 Tax=Microbulbifer sp. SH-1 TaxID=2681547 RepID=UPI0014084B9F|nr:hypothetical protein [Microbulbifer sp. SH-1]
MYKKLALALAVTALTACGGGGGGSSDGGGGSSSSSSSSGGSSSSSSSSGGNGSPVSIGGTAAKGIISGALVEAHKADGTVIGTATTAADGSYRIDLGRYSGAVKLVLTNPAEGKAMVTCDTASCRAAGTDDADTDSDGVIEFGEQYALDYELSSVVYVDETATEVSSSITALTTLVSEKAGVQLDQASIAAANSFVKNALGLDANPDTIAPVDLTKATEANEQQLRFALVNAAIEQAADGDVAAQLAGLTAGFASNAIGATALQGISNAITLVAETAGANNTALGGVADAAAGAGQDIASAIEDNCSDSGTCLPPIEFSGELATNLQQAKALVATARKVSVEALAAINAEIDVDSESYNPDNIVVKLQSAESLLDSETQHVLTAFREVSDVLVNQISAVEFGVEPALETPFFNLSDAAGYLWDKYLEDTDYDSRASAMAHFPAGSIVKNGTVWTLSNGVYDLDGSHFTTDDQVAVNITITLPDLSGEPGSISMPAGENILSIEGATVLGDNRFALGDGSKVTLALAESFAEDAEGDPIIESVSIAVNGSLENASYGFEGAIALALSEGESYQQMMPDNDALLLLPEKLSLQGTFTDKAKVTDVAAGVTLTIDNVNEYGFYPSGYQRQDLVSYVYDETDNSLTVTFGTEANQVVARYTLSVDSTETYTDYYITAECVSVIGEAECNLPARTYFGGLATAEQMSYDDCWSLDFAWNWENGICYYSILAQDTGVQQDIRVAFDEYYGEWLLAGSLKARVPGEGTYVPGPDDWYETLGFASIVPSDAATGAISATLIYPEMDVDAEGRYAKATFRANASGKLSATLPEMDIELVLKRTGYEVADLSLALAWGSDSLRVEYTYEGEDSAPVILLTDGEGSVFELSFSSEGEAVGTISKDGTVYGTLTEEGDDIYVITWIDNAIETLL